MDQCKKISDSNILTVSFMAIILLTPLSAFILLERSLGDVSTIMYGAFFAILSFTACMLWVKFFMIVFNTSKPSMERKSSLKDISLENFPSATAIIAGHLSKEFDELLYTIEGFSKVKYPGKLQIMVVYSNEESSSSAKQESELESTIKSSPSNFSLHRISDVYNNEELMTYATQNAVGDFIGLFFSGHYPKENCMLEALKWREIEAMKKNQNTVDETWSASYLHPSTSSSFQPSAMDRVVSSANEFVSNLWKSEVSSLKEVLQRSDLSFSTKSQMIFEYMWQRVFPYAVIQLLPILAFFWYKQSLFFSLDDTESSFMATKLIMSTY